MRSSALIAFLLPAFALAAPYSPFPLSNGFPTPSPDQLQSIQQGAHGTLPNAPPPPNISDTAIAVLTVIAFNEIFEVAYFTDLIANITNDVDGYSIKNKDEVLLNLNVIVNQEQLHALNANGALKHFNQTPVQPCKYKFPVSDFKSAITFAALFTDVVLGTLQDANVALANPTDFGLIRGVTSVVGQEGEQNGWYRVLQGKVPSALPFLTASATPFAVNALLQNVIVPDTCPDIARINAISPTFLALQITSPPPGRSDVVLAFAIPFSSNDALCSVSADALEAGFSIVYINQQNLPIVEGIQNASVSKNNDGFGTFTFQANFPYSANLMNGLTITALVNGTGPFAGVDDAAMATVAGPGLISID